MKTLLKSDYEKLHAKKNQLLKDLRAAEIDIGKAAEFGDLSENAEFEAAKEKRERVGERIRQVDEQLAGAFVIDDADVPNDEVTIGKRVEILDLEDDDVMEYKLVGSDPDRDKDEISVESPLAQAMLGSKEGDTFKLELPNGAIRDLKVQKILVD